MELGLDGQVAVVTGASRGIGLAIASALAAEGALVVAGARETSTQLDALTRGDHVRAVFADLATVEGASELVATAAAEFGRIDILVNNVGGVTPRLDGFLSITDEQWTRSVNLNLMTAVRTTRAALPTMLAAARGSIVITSSVNAVLPDPAVLDYCAAKAALANFAKALSKEVGPHGIRVNAISPGPVATDLWLGGEGVAAAVAAATGADAKSVTDDTAARAVTGRFTRPEEVANLALFLASDRVAGNITGANLTIDGGFTAETH